MQILFQKNVYFLNNNEIYFIIQHGVDIIPVEVKAGETKSAPSFKRLIANNQPKYAIRFSKRNYRQDRTIINIPLYLARKTIELL